MCTAIICINMILSVVVIAAVATSGAASDLTGLANVATSGDGSDLESGSATLFQALCANGGGGTSFVSVPLTALVRQHHLLLEILGL